MRGSRTHGWGQVAQHRRTGAKGGSGMAGLHKHKFSYMVKYDPDHFGSNKWHPPQPAVTTKWANVGDLVRISGSSSEVDLGKLGYDKLLGQGQITKALTVKVPRASASAIEKIKAAGGKVEVQFESKPEEETKQAGSPNKDEKQSLKPSTPKASSKKKVR
ncbi:MAG: uL15 family ribosomal protein [Nitrososphaerales archaeon]